MAQAIDGDPGDVDPGGGVGSPHQVILWTCPGRQDVSVGRRILALSAAGVLLKSVPVVDPGDVFVVLGHSPRGVRYKAVFHLVRNPYMLPGAVFHPRVKPSSDVYSWAVCHQGDRKRREEFPRRFKDVHSPSGPESPCCRMLREKKFVFSKKRSS